MKATFWWMMCGVVLFFALMGFILWSQRHWKDPIEQLPAEQRKTLYESNLGNFGRMCEAQSVVSSLTEFCDEQAKVLRRFPECNESCLQRTEKFVKPVPTR